MNTEQKTPTGGELEDGPEGAIDAAIRAHRETLGSTPKNRDVDPDSFEAKLRLTLPGHACFKRESAVPEPLRKLLGSLGGEATIEQAPTTIKAIYTTAQGVWMVKATECGRGDTHDHPADSISLELDGPSIEVKRDEISHTGALTLMRALGFPMA